MLAIQVLLVEYGVKYNRWDGRFGLASLIPKSQLKSIQLLNVNKVIQKEFNF